MSLRIFLLTLAVVVTLPAVTPHAAQPRPRLNRLWPLQDLAVLDGPDRDRWQKPDRVMDALRIADGSIVAELGAASGWFTVRLARRVGPNGLVYAEDRHPEMVAAIARRARREGLANVRPVLGRAGDPGLPRESLDAILIVGGYAEMPDAVDRLRAAARALKPRGRLGIVEFRARGGGPAPPPHERVDPERIIEHARAAGLRLLDRADFLDFQHLLIFAP